MIGVPTRHDRWRFKQRAAGFVAAVSVERLAERPLRVWSVESRADKLRGALRPREK